MPARPSVMWAIVIAFALSLCHGVHGQQLDIRRSLTQKCLRCPPPQFDSVRNFNLTKYAAAPWFVQKQDPTSYQPVESLYCVRAQYTLRNPKNPKEGVIVNNTARTGGVNGPGMGQTGPGGMVGVLIGLPDSRETGPTAASKLRVGPEVLTTRLPPAAWYQAFGQYWVAAVGPSKNAAIGYDWAIVVGGSPAMKGKKGCRVGPAGQYFGGLWLFSRKPVDPRATAIMMQKIRSWGLDTSELRNVQQKGCTY